MRLREPTSWVFAAAVVAGCGAAGNYVYTPEGAIASVDGRPVTRIEIPPEEPRGTVRVESFGLTSLAVDANREVEAIHVRLTVGNDSSDTPFVFDSREQLLEIPGQGRSRAFFANSDRNSLPVLQIPRREQRVVDLYYPLPANVQSEDDLRKFELLWQVNTGDRMVAQRTPFGRMSIEPEVSYSTSLYAGWGPYWWYDPFYPSHAFLHHRPVIVRRPGHVTVRPRPGQVTIRDHRVRPRR